MTAAADVIGEACATLARRCSDPRLKMLGVDVDLRSIVDALTELSARERELRAVLAMLVARMNAAAARPLLAHSSLCECEPCALTRMVAIG